MPPQPAHLLLSALSSASRDAPLTQCAEVDLPLRESLYEQDNVPRYAYFLTSGIASVVTAMRNGGTLEWGLSDAKVSSGVSIFSDLHGFPRAVSFN